MNNRNEMGYSSVADSVATTFNTMFVKAASTIVKQPVFGKNAKPSLPDVKVKRFVPICHYCNKLAHIRPKCFKYKNTRRMNRIKHSYIKSRTTLKHKINLKNKSVKKIWVKKLDLNCCVASNSLKAIFIDYWYFDKGCSRHIIVEKKPFHETNAS